ncbi:hypothetical protein LX95_00948 [Mesonia algae]|uniref:Uncharacterized protein n=1 Tax=Mesonia algae TaxID=213248 RepID=A0A2W7IAR8_9FLAO|nr:hypothetical protein [Mesonia algae]PZW42632.1 hypothetical protein LX95_00948 [Mesonia algae]
MKKIIVVISRWFKIGEDILIKKKVLIGSIASLLLIFTYLSDIISLITGEEDKESNDKIETTTVMNDYSRIVNDSSKNNNVIDASSTTINNNDLSTTNIYIDKTSKQKVIDNKVITYKLIGKNSQELKKKIESGSNIKITNNSDNSIEVTHTGEILILSEGIDSYIFTGGNIEVLINGTICNINNDYKIPKLRPNSKKAISNEIQKIINKIVNENIYIFSNRIIQCIKN